MHFCWKERQSASPEDDLIIFPDEAEWVAVPQCTTGRVFMLKFKTSAQKLFFWMQEPSDAKDKEYLEKINKVLTNPPAASEDQGSE
jgi:26S proteasome regulatory subunit N13